MNAHAHFPRRPVPDAPVPHDDEIHVPLWLAMMMLALALVSIGAVATGRLLEVGVTREELPHAGATVDFVVHPEAAGPLVADIGHSRKVSLVQDGEDGFARMIVEGLQTVRARSGVRPDAPLRLVVDADGQRLIVDPAIGRTVRLAAYGYENGRAFDALLSAQRS